MMIRLGSLLLACAVAALGPPAEAAPSASESAISNVDLSDNGPDRAASVPDIAVDPRDPARVAVVWRFISMPKPGEDASSRTWICHLSLSKDGGRHFSDQAIDWNTPDTPRCNAPYVDIGANGELILGATLTARDPNNRPPGYRPFGRVAFRKSMDWGATWSDVRSVIATGDEARFAPNPSVPPAAEAVPWDGARGVVDRDNGDIYVSGGYPAPPGGADYSQRFYSASSDGGRSWGPIRAFGASGWPQRWDGHIVAGHGELAFAYIAAAVPDPVAHCPCIVFGDSTDHGVTVTRHFVTEVKDMDTLVHYPPLAVDPSRPAVFALAKLSDDGKQVDVFSSTNNGALWTKMGPVAQPADVARVSRPALVYTPRGGLVLMWRGYHTDGSFDVYAAASEDRGFGAPLRLSAATSHVPQALISDYAIRGDFIEVEVADSADLHAAWTDWRTGDAAQVYYGRVPLSQLPPAGH